MSNVPLVTGTKVTDSPVGVKGDPHSHDHCRTPKDCVCRTCGSLVVLPDPAGQGTAGCPPRGEPLHDCITSTWEKTRNPDRASEEGKPSGLSIRYSPQNDNAPDYRCPTHPQYHNTSSPCPWYERGLVMTSCLRFRKNLVSTKPCRSPGQGAAD